MSGDYGAALNLYLSLVNTNISYKLYHRIAKCYYKMGDIKNAEENFLQSINLEKGENPSYIYLGNIAYKQENIRSAIYYWACAFAYKPDDDTVCLNLATSYFSCGMKFQSVYYYEKYLKHAQDRGNAYNTVKQSIDEYSKIGNEFLQKAKQALTRKDYKGAIEFLTFAYKNLPTSYDINLLLGTAYLAENDNMHAMIYLKQAYCINKKSLDVLQMLTSVFINLGDYTAAYCSLRRILPLVINDQEEYLNTMQVIKELNSTFDEKSYLGHKEWGDNYYRENNFHFALFEYENCTLLNEDLSKELSEKIEQLNLFINPENRIINLYLSKANSLFNKGDIKNANKYFSKIMLFAEPETQEYKLAKSRVTNA
jgi:tetratricopeptide (TPR) repeat protein